MSATPPRSDGSRTAEPSSDPARSAGFDARTGSVVTAWSLFGIMPGMVVAVVVAIVAAPLLGLLALVVVAGAWALYVRLQVRGALDRVLGQVGARPLPSEDEPRWANVVDGLGVTSGVNDPELWVIDGVEANALAAASEDRAVLVVTRGLVDSLTVVELEGVAANLLGRIKDGSARYGTVVVGLLGPFLGTVDAAGKILADGLGDQRAVHTDLAAVAMTRYPPGLAAALEHLERIGTERPGVPPATAHLWMAPVIEGDVGIDPAVAATVAQPLDYRAAVLHEL